MQLRNKTRDFHTIGEKKVRPWRTIEVADTIGYNHDYFERIGIEPEITVGEKTNIKIPTKKRREEK